MATIGQLNDELFYLSRALSTACNKLELAASEFALKEHLYRKAKATAYLQAEGKTIEHKKAQVDDRCEHERLDAKLAEAQKVATYERVRSLRAQLSALQSIAAGTRAELENLGTPDPIEPIDHHEPIDLSDDEESDIPF